jgi:hypothetical protein
MRTILVASAFCIALGLVLLSLPAPQAGADTVPSIAGNYRLVKRVLPDGTEMKSPDIVGFITWSKEYRSLNVLWEKPDGKSFTISLVSKYVLTPTEYTETNSYMLQNDEGGTGVKLDRTGAKASSPVKAASGTIEFQMPLFGEPAIRFEGNTFTATRKGEFVDHWEKVD